MLSGPNIAREVAEGFAAAATLAMPDQWTADRLQPLFHSSLFRVYTATDVAGVELAGALKNVFAIAVGFGDGLDAGVNTRAMVITRGLRELTRLGTAMGGRIETFYGLAGMGDLIATCTSPLSRNRYGRLRTRQGSVDRRDLSGMKQVAEGVRTSSVVIELACGHGIDMPIAARGGCGDQPRAAGSRCLPGVAARPPDMRSMGTRGDRALLGFGDFIPSAETRGRSIHLAVPDHSSDNSQSEIRGVDGGSGS